MYELIFEPNSQGRERYEICTQSILMTNKGVTRDNEDDFIELLRKFKKIGVKSDEKIGKVTLYDLGEQGGVVHLERSEYKLLLEGCIQAEIWRPAILEQKRECEDWVKSIKQVPGSLAVDARPEEKRRAIALMEAADAGTSGVTRGE